MGHLPSLKRKRKASWRRGRWRISSSSTTTRPRRRRKNSWRPRSCGPWWAGKQCTKRSRTENWGQSRLSPISRFLSRLYTLIMLSSQWPSLYFFHIPRWMNQTIKPELHCVPHTLEYGQLRDRNPPRSPQCQFKMTVEIALKTVNVWMENILIIADLT